MKAKKIVGLMACAAACASFSSFAATTDWFAATPSGTETNLVGATATGTFTVENGKFNVDNGEDTALKFTPTGSEPVTSDGIVVISATAELTPNSTNDFDTIIGAKAGFAVGVDDHDVTNYYGYANGAWTKLTGAEPTSPETSFKLVIDYRAGKKTVKFFVGDTQLSSGTSFSIGDASALTSVDAFGTGSISSIDADCEVAEVAIGDVKYGSVADALADSGTMDTIKNVDSSGTISEGATAANGLPMAVCVAAGASVTDPSAVITAVPVDNDTNTGNVTLQMDATGLNPESGVVINFAVKQGGAPVQGSPFPANAILVPCATGIYTVEPVSVTVAP